MYKCHLYGGRIGAHHIGESGQHCPYIIICGTRGCRWRIRRWLLILNSIP